MPEWLPKKGASVHKGRPDETPNGGIRPLVDGLMRSQQSLNSSPSPDVGASAQEALSAQKAQEAQEALSAQETLSAQ